MGEEYVRRIMVLGEVAPLGPVVLSDDIEGVLKWTKDDGTGDSVFEKCATVAYNGSASLHMKTKTTGAAADDIIGARRYSFQRPGKRYRLEVIFRIEDRSDMKSCGFVVWLYDGTYQHTVALNYDSQNGKWQYWGSDDSYHDVTGGSQSLFQVAWHRLLMEYDEAKGEYVRMQCDGLGVDLSGVAYAKSSNTTGLRQTVKFQIITQGAAPAEAYFDDVLLMEI